jgi:hypothetical protein
MKAKEKGSWDKEAAMRFCADRPLFFIVIGDRRGSKNAGATVLCRGGPLLFPC